MTPHPNRARQKFTMPDLEALKLRHATACDLKQTIDRAKIAISVAEWAKQIGAPAETKISFVESGENLKRAAWDAWAAWAAWTASYTSINAIGAVALNDEAQAKTWLPVLEAFEAGAFAFFVTDAEIFVSTIPAKVAVDDQRRLHCEDGPAFVWVTDVQDYYWHGVNVPPEWIKEKKSLSATTALKWENLEQRRAALEIVGWANVLNELKAKVIDKDEDEEIGELLEVKLPDIGKERFLKVRCGTGRVFALPMPPHVKTALEGQAWSYGVDTQVIKALQFRT